MRLLDVQGYASEETIEFKTVDHQDLVKAFVYWMDQCKTLFGEPTTVKSFHGFREEGIDVTTDISTPSQIRFGVQVKSIKISRKILLQGKFMHR
jgi:hypothetical protein